MELKLPNLVFVSDYHEFSSVAFHVNCLLAKGTVRVAEIGHNGADYVGVVYTGRKPGQKTINALLEQKGVGLVD